MPVIPPPPLEIVLGPVVPPRRGGPVPPQQVNSSWRANASSGTQTCERKSGGAARRRSNGRGGDCNRYSQDEQYFESRFRLHPSSENAFRMTGTAVVFLNESIGYFILTLCLCMAFKTEPVLCILRLQQNRSRHCQDIVIFVQQ